MQKKDSNQRRHLFPGWCGPGRLSWRAPWGPGFSSQSPQHRFPPIALPMFLSWIYLNGVWIQSWFPVSVQHRRYYKRERSRRGGDIRTFRPGFSSTETEMQMILNPDESKHSYQISGFIQIWLVWLSLPAVLHELLTWFGYKQQAKVD